MKRARKACFFDIHMIHCSRQKYKCLFIAEFTGHNRGEKHEGIGFGIRNGRRRRMRDARKGAGAGAPVRARAARQGGQALQGLLDRPGRERPGGRGRRRGDGRRRAGLQLRLRRARGGQARGHLEQGARRGQGARAGEARRGKGRGLSLQRGLRRRGALPAQPRPRRGERPHPLPRRHSERHDQLHARFDAALRHGLRRRAQPGPGPRLRRGRPDGRRLGPRRAAQDHARLRGGL